MPQADVSKLVSRLRIKISPTHKKLKNPKGPEGRHEIIRKIVTGLFKYERLELVYTKADEARGYAERLISEAIRHGDGHKPTMELADYWIEEKQVVHKLFKVLAPRYENYNIAYTRMFKVTGHYPDGRFPRSVLELRGNPFPPLTQDLSTNRNLLHNVLLDEAKKEYRTQKYSEMAEQLSADSNREMEQSKNALEKQSEKVTEHSSGSEIPRVNIAEGDLQSVDDQGSSKEHTGGETQKKM